MRNLGSEEVLEPLINGSHGAYRDWNTEVIYISLQNEQQESFAVIQSLLITG